jgi:hypothetical protein
MECIGVIEFVTPVFLFVAVRFFLCGDFQLYVSEVAALCCNYRFLRRLFDAIAVGFGCSGRRGGRRAGLWNCNPPAGCNRRKVWRIKNELAGFVIRLASAFDSVLVNNNFSLLRIRFEGPLLRVIDCFAEQQLWAGQCPCRDNLSGAIQTDSDNHDALNVPGRRDVRILKLFKRRDVDVRVADRLVLALRTRAEREKQKC